MDKYILKNKKPVRCEDWNEWTKFMSSKDNICLITSISDLIVSTVFLGRNFNWDNTGNPILFETMIFIKNEELYSLKLQWRYETLSAAEIGHEKVVEAIKTGKNLEELDVT